MHAICLNVPLFWSKMWFFSWQTHKYTDPVVVIIHLTLPYGIIAYNYSTFYPVPITMTWIQVLLLQAVPIN